MALLTDEEVKPFIQDSPISALLWGRARPGMGDLQICSGADCPRVVPDLNGDINQRADDADTAEDLQRFLQGHGFLFFRRGGLVGSVCGGR